MIEILYNLPFFFAIDVPSVPRSAFPPFGFAKILDHSPYMTKVLQEKREDGKIRRFGSFFIIHHSLFVFTPHT
jgi:hypothetical protein